MQSWIHCLALSQTPSTQDVLLQRWQNLVTEGEYDPDESLPQRQHEGIGDNMVEHVDCQGTSTPSADKKWSVETRSVRGGDIVLALFDRKIGKGD